MLPVALDERVRGRVAAQFRLCPAVQLRYDPASQRLGLGEEIGYQQVVLADERAQRLGEADYIARDQLGALMQQLGD